LNRGKRIVHVLEFRDTFPNLSAIADGFYDAQLYDLAGQIRADGREIEMRPLHEFNGKCSSFLLHCTAAV
jgi:hypothetical protein